MEYGLALASLLPLFVVGCSDSGSSGAAPPAGSAAEFTVFTDAVDSRLVRVRPNDEQVLEFHGKRDVHGVPQMVTGISLADDSGLSIYELGMDGLPRSIFTPSGVRFELEWNVAAKTAVLVATTADGSTQINTLVDLSGTAPSPSPFASVAAGRRSFAADGQRGTIDPRELANEPPDPGAPSMMLPGGPCVVRTNVLRCSLQEGGAQVVTFVFDTITGENLAAFHAAPIAPGLYEATFPAGEMDITNSEETCLAIAGVLTNLCQVAELVDAGGQLQFCLALADAFDALTLTRPIDGAPVLAACASAFAGIELYCDALNHGSDAQSLADILSDAEFVDGSLPAEIRVDLCVVAPSHVCTSAVIPSVFPFPLALGIDLGGEATIRDVTLEPTAPTASEGYVVSADVACLPAGAEVRLSIVSTDGYTDSIVHPVESAMNGGVFTLEVPGAALGVHDVVTTEVELESGAIVMRTTCLSFN